MNAERERDGKNVSKSKRKQVLRISAGLHVKLPRMDTEMNLMEKMFQISMVVDVFERSKEMTSTKKLSKTGFLLLCRDIIKNYLNKVFDFDDTAFDDDAAFEKHVEQYLLSYETYHKTGDV